jgi:1-acyl-sn-glycerol-3-phosphate acyltransferase
MRILVILHTFLVRFLLSILCIAIVPFVLCISLLPPRIRFSSTIVFWIVYIFYRLAIKCTLVPVKYIWQGTVPLEPTIFIANHQSSLDIPLVGIITKSHPHVWIARDELMKTFLLRFILPIFAIVTTVDNAYAAAASLRRIFRILNETKAHLMIFPEGSRSLDGRLQHFFDGFVLLAKKTGRPVVPIYIHNVQAVYPRTTFWIHYHPITVVVGPKFTLESQETDQGFKSRIIAWFHDTQQNLAN